MRKQAADAAREAAYQSSRETSAQHKAAASQQRRRSSGQRQNKLDAYLPQHAARAQKLERIARKESTQW
eukprot:COSAG04_NODE_6175_length_1392_cov_1.244393_1_plen_68_part_10